MGRREQRERERKRAASSCKSIEHFLPIVKKSCSSEGQPSTSPSDLSCSTSVNVVSDSVQPSLNLVQNSTTCCTTSDIVIQVSPTITPSGPESSVGLSTEPCSSSSVSTSILLDPQLHQPPIISQSDSFHPDIGKIYADSKLSSLNFCSTIQSLSASEKYALLKKHDKPSEHHLFPCTMFGNYNRQFQFKWFDIYPWIVYSTVVEGIFCIFCALFCVNRDGMASLVNKPFCSWNKFHEKCKNHGSSKIHHQSMLAAETFVNSIEHPETGLIGTMDAKRIANIAQNRVILKFIIEATLFCAKQCIALRGDCEDLESSKNPGNFLSILKLMANHNDVLHTHLYSPAMKNVTYISPRTQNELLNIMGRHIVLFGIVQEIKTAKFYSILADEVTSHNTEHLALCTRFVDAKGDIREEFMTFLSLERLTGRYIAEKIIEFLKDNDLNVENIRGQGYDGASNMSSERVGVQAQIKELSPLATYIHCSSHQLNLVITHSCILAEVRNVVDQLQHCCHFFLASPKRSGLLELIVSKGVVDKCKRKPLLDLCKTRWAERHTAYQHFYQSFTYIVEALEYIGCKLHLHEYGELYADWDVNSRSDAQQILHGITNFSFIVVFLTIYQYLSHLSGITIKLQSRAIDVYEAFEMIEDIRKVYKNERDNVDGGFQIIYDQAVRMADKVGCIVSAPRTVGRQQHRSNVSSTTPIEHYKRNVAIPFLDHVLTHLNEQFSSLSVNASYLLTIVPSVMFSKPSKLSEITAQYQQDLPSPELLEMEMCRWKCKFSTVSADKLPNSPSEAIKVCDAQLYPNIRILLQIACTLPVTSCECERSASVLRRLKNYMRATMGNERLANLALLHTHYDQHIDTERVIDIYAQMHPRRIELETLL